MGRPNCTPRVMRQWLKVLWLLLVWQWAESAGVTPQTTLFLQIYYVVKQGSQTTLKWVIFSLTQIWLPSCSSKEYSAPTDRCTLLQIFVPSFWRGEESVSCYRQTSSHSLSLSVSLAKHYLLHTRRLLSLYICVCGGLLTNLRINLTLIARCLENTNFSNRVKTSR